MKTSLGAPKVEKPFLGWKLVRKAEKHKILAKNGSPGPKNQNFRKMKKKTQVFAQRPSVPNFRKIQQCLASLGLPEGFRSIFGPKMGPRGPKIKIFEKDIKSPSGICQKNKCTKFQEHPTMFGLSRLPRRFSVHFWAKNASPGPKNQNF